MTSARRILVLLTDAYGGHGGIAQYNRHLLQALSNDSRVALVVAMPRLNPDVTDTLPSNLEYVATAAKSSFAYLREVVRRLLSREAFDVVICSHINLLPIAFFAALRFRAKLILVAYGAEVWQPPRRRFDRLLLGRVDCICSISETTRERMQTWWPLKFPMSVLLPNAYDPDAFAPGPKPAHIVERYALHNRSVLLMLGRMNASERLKGFDEILEATPQLLREIPDLVVVFAGDGSDRARLEEKAETLGVAERTRFTGYVPEHEKSDLYRLADAFILPSRQEGFGYVLIEAMACGVPSIGSSADGSREAMLDGQLGAVIDPSNQSEIVRAVKHSIAQPRGVPPGLAFFALDQFQERVAQFLNRIFEARLHEGASKDRIVQS